MPMRVCNFARVSVEAACGSWTGQRDLAGANGTIIAS